MENSALMGATGFDAPRQIHVKKETVNNLVAGFDAVNSYEHRCEERL